jgi:hypothetical protein
MSNGLPKLHGITPWRTVITIKFSSQPFVKTHSSNFTRITSVFMTDMRRDMTSLVGTGCMRNALTNYNMENPSPKAKSSSARTTIFI